MAASPYPSEERMREVFGLVAEHVERRYGIPIAISDVTDPYTGDLDGAEIKIDYANEIDNALFGVADARRHLVAADPQAQLALQQFGEAQKLVEMSRAPSKAAR